MHKTSEFDRIIQQLNTLSLAELLAVSARVAEAKEDDSLEQVIELVDEWMADESRYDEETYPQIQAALTQNPLSV